MRYKALIISITFLCSFGPRHSAMGAEELVLSGIVLDEKGEPLRGATIRLSPGSGLAITDGKGHFEIEISAMVPYTLEVSYVGYSTEIQKIAAVEQDISISVRLEPSVETLNEVVVSKSREALLKKEESLSIEVVNESFIRQNLSGSFMQSMERLPGVSTIGIGSGQSKPLIRGLGFNRVVVVDKGVKHEGQQWGADHGLEIDQFSVHQAEVIKGAASFMYGSDAIGGAIDIKPAPLPQQQTLGGSVDLVGKTNNNLFGGSLNLFGRANAAFFNARVTHQSYGDYKVPTDRVNVYNFPVDLHNNQLRNSAGNETNLHLDVGVAENNFQSVFYISNINSTSGFFANAHGLEPRQVDRDLHDKSDRDILYPRQEVNHFKVINKSKFTFAERHQLETEVGYQHNFRQEYNQYVNHGYMPPVYPESNPIPQDLEREFTKHVYSLNARDHIWVGNHNIKVGLNAEHQDNTIGGWGFLVPAFTQTTAGAFIYDKYTVSDNFLFNAALRYDYGTIHIKEYTDWFVSEVQQGAADTESVYVERAQNQSREFNNLVWSAGFNYNVGNLSLKSNLGKSFRMPIAKELGANGVNYHYFSYEKGDIDLDPEQSYQLDLGISWSDKKWYAEVTPFYNYFTNYIYLNPTSRHDYLYGAGNQVFEYRQSEVARYGTEIQARWEFAKTFEASFFGEYVYAKQQSGHKKGYTLPFSPPASALINLTWSPDFNKRLANSSIGIDWRITAAQNNIVPPEKKTAGYQIFNIRANTQLDLYNNPVEVSLQVQNVLNTRYMNHTSFYRLIDLPEPGRNIILSIHIPFKLNNNRL
jgi:iron complex outermembrane receptor protein